MVKRTEPNHSDFTKLGRHAQRIVDMLSPSAATAKGNGNLEETQNEMRDAVRHDSKRDEHTDAGQEQKVSPAGSHVKTTHQQLPLPLMMQDALEVAARPAAHSMRSFRGYFGKPPHPDKARIRRRKD